MVSREKISHSLHFDPNCNYREGGVREQRSFYRNLWRLGVARHIVDTLPRILPVSQHWKLALLQNWSTIIGTLHDKVVLHKVGDDHVVLRVVHPSLAQELHYLSELLREKINNALDQPRINALHFRTGIQSKKTAFRTKPLKKRGHEVHHAPRQVRFTPREKSALTKIDNTELRSALCAFYTTCKRRRAPH